MADITTVWDVQNARGDWQIAGSDLLSGDDLQTAVLISAFTDRLANADDVIPDGTPNRRGWCLDDPATPIGSRLWLLTRSVLSQQVAALAQAYLLEALEWLITDGVAADIEVYTQIVLSNQLDIVVQIFKSSGNTVAMQFNWAWSEIS